MQLVDIITGALGYENRNFKEGFINSEAKKEIIKLIKLRSNYSLRKSTLLREEKLNILMWKAMGYVDEKKLLATLFRIF